jgi:hypothetical protein
MPSARRRWSVLRILMLVYLFSAANGLLMLALEQALGLRP